MTDGLITRIGKWIDNKWESKVTESQLGVAVANAMDNLEALDSRTQERCSNLAKLIASVATDSHAESSKLKTDIELMVKARSDDKLEKEVADLKTRMEKMELYAGMTRKIDPTKPPVVKSAFQM